MWAKVLFCFEIALVIWTYNKVENLFHKQRYLKAAFILKSTATVYYHFQQTLYSAGYVNGYLTLLNIVEFILWIMLYLVLNSY